MDITEVRVSLRDEEKLKAYASIVFDNCFIVKDLRVIDGNDRLWVAMPNKKRRDGTRRDVCHPLNAETRTLIEEAVLSKYDELMRENLYKDPTEDEETPVEETPVEETPVESEEDVE